MADVALVTGGGSGIGAGICRALARRGVNVALLGRDAGRLQSVAAELQGLQVQALAVPCDLTDLDACAAARRAVIDRFGSIHYLIHCAGQLAHGPLAEVSAAEMQAAVGVNLTAAMWLSQLCLEDLAETQGAMLFIASTAGRVPFPYFSVYCGAKHGLIGFAEALRFECTARGVHVAVGFPPMTATRMTQPLAERSPYRIKLADPDDVGERLVKALLKGRSTIYVGWLDWLLCGLSSGLSGRLLRRVFRWKRSLFARLAEP